MSQAYLQSIFNVSWKLFLNLCSSMWLSLYRNILRYLIFLRLWQLNMKFALGLVNFTLFFLKVLRLTAFWVLGSNLFRSMITDGKSLLKEPYLTLHGRILFAFLIEYVLFILWILSKWFFWDLHVFLKLPFQIQWKFDVSWKLSFFKLMFIKATKSKLYSC